MIRATTHQGSSIFQGNGRQCMLNSLAAILHSKKTPISSWCTKTLDNILQSGDNLYTLHNADSYLMLENLLPKCNGFYDELKIGNALTGQTMDTFTSNGPYYILEEAFEKIFENNSACLFTMGNSTPSYSTAILYENESYYIFDPHSRDENGMPISDGFAVFTQHSSKSALCTFIRQLSKHISLETVVSYEVASVDAMIKIHSDIETDTESNFDGFSEVSDGEVACRLYLVNESLNDISSCSSASDSSVFSDDDNSDSISIPEVAITANNLNDSSILINNINIDVFDSSFDLDGCADDQYNQLYENVITSNNLSGVFSGF